MRLLGSTRNLKIITENCHSSEEEYYKNSGIKYPLYEVNYISGVRTIFQQAIELEAREKANYDRFIPDEKRNILSFIGDRGTGKTTAMDEFCRILDSMRIDERRDWWLNHTLYEEEREILSKAHFYFHILKPIDASLLSDKEDLFELILANLYHKFEERMKQSKVYGFEDNSLVRSIMNDFSEIAKLYRNMMAHDMEEYGSAFISRLQLMAGSQQIQEKVSVLIKKLLHLEKVDYKGERKDKSELDCRNEYEIQYLCSERVQNRYDYIVIAIDDLDLNLKNGYEMLEQIQKYFSDSRIIVLITLDYEQMRLVCEEYFGRDMSEITKEYGKKLADDYMMKIFHLSQRMYMPNFNRISKKSYIVLPEKICIGKNKDKHEIQVKQFVLSKVAEAMHIYYDACGLKEHFAAPETIRSLVSYNEFLEALDIVEYDKLVSYEKLNGDIKQQEINAEILRKYDQNHERFNEDISVRMVQRTLNYEQKRAFELLKQCSLERRAKYFVYMIRDGEKINFNDITGRSYSYGMLLEKIYKWRRVSKRINRNGLPMYTEVNNYFEDRPFICCILASFTSEMVCEYIKYRYKPSSEEQVKDEERKKYKRRLMGFMGTSFGNKWIGDIFPKVKIETLNDIYNERKVQVESYGYVENVHQQKLNIRISLNKLQMGKKGTIEEIKERVGVWLDKENVIETLECIDMFFIRKEGGEYKGIEYVFESKNALSHYERINKKFQDDYEALNMNKHKELVITGKGETGNLDIMAFAAKSLDYQNSKKNLHNNIRNGLEKFLGEYLEMIIDDEKMRAIGEIIDDRLEKKSLFKYITFNPWFEYEVAFPFYDLDMSYNIFKRLKDEFKNKIIEQENLLVEIGTFYDNIEKLLCDEEEMYSKLVTFKYAEIFRNSPYIKAVRGWKEKEIISKRLRDAFYDMALSKPSEVND